MPRMDVTIVKKGAKGPMDDDALVEDAIRDVASRIDGFDTDSLMGSYREKMKPGEGQPQEMSDGEEPMSKEDCPDCAAGTCTRPEHMDEDMLREMLSSMGDKE